AASLHGGAEARPCTNRILLRVSGDEELEGARDDAKFDREAREGLAVDLRVDGICGERFAEEGFRFEEFDALGAAKLVEPERRQVDRKSTRLNSSHDQISYAVFCLKKKKHGQERTERLK